MCYFVFVGAPKRQHSTLMESLVNAGFEVSVTQNQTIVATFPKSDTVSVVSYKGCSCDIYAEKPVSFDEAAERARYRKKGWSKSKIDRAILGKRRPERPALASFRNCLATFTRRTKSVRVLAHFFHGAVDTEPVAVKHQRAVSLEEYLQASGTFAADVLYEIRVT